MNTKNSKHFLDDTIKRAKKENAQRDAEKIYNYNKWKDNHDKMVDQELKKLNHKSPNIFKAIFIALLLAFIIEIIYILTINDPQTIINAIQEIKIKFTEIGNIILTLMIP